MAKYALITGATSGIGEVFAYKLAKEGYHLIVAGRNTLKLKQLKERISKYHSKKVYAYQVDFLSKEELKAFTEAIKALGVPIHVLINNAGIGAYGAFSEIEEVVNDEIVDVNISALTYLTKAFYPQLTKGSKVLQVASTAAFAPGPYMATYYASKAYVLSLGLALREEWKREQISVSILCPGPTKTAFQQRAKMQKADFAKALAMETKDVVNVAYKGMMGNKAIIVPGIGNQLAAGVMHHLPKSCLASLVNLTQKK